MSFCPHGLPDIAALGADVYLFSLYKVYGPHLGAMYVRAGLAAELPSQSHFFKGDALAGRFTPAGPDHAQVAAVNGVIDYWKRSRPGTATRIDRCRAGGGGPAAASATTKSNCCSRCSTSLAGHPGCA